MSEESNFSRLTGLKIFYAISIAVFLFNAWFLSINYETLSEHQKASEQSGLALNEIDLMMSSLKDVETGGRGFLLTRKDEYLEPLRRGRLEVWEHYNRVSALTVRGSAREGLLRTLEDLMRQRIDVIEETVQSFRRRGSAPSDASQFAEGKELMDGIRRIVGELKMREKAEGQARAADVRRSQTYFFLALIFTTGLCIVVVSIAFQQFRRNQLRMAQESRERAEESYFAQQESAVSQQLSGDLSVEAAARRLMDYLSQSLKVPAANLYLWEDELRPVASIGTDLVSVESGKNALPLEAFRKTEPWEIAHVPESYWRIQSGMGAARPTSLVFVPLPYQGRNVGVLELASFDDPGTISRRLLNAIGRTAGIGLAASQSRVRLQALLEKSQQQAEELQAQQEELRTNNEELEEQARTLEQQQHTLQVQNEELDEARRMLETRAGDLERVNQYKSEFLAKMSHELRTPLNSLLILSTLLIENREGNLTDQQREFAHSIQTAGNDLLGLINDILDLAKIEARKMTLKPEEFTVGEMTESLRAMFGPQATMKNLEFRVETDEGAADARLRTDRMRIEQILRNFLSNAVKFTESGRILLRASVTENDEIALTVEDTGVGIPPDKQRLVFEAFEQADGSVSRRYGGTGLGLTISRELAGLLGGRIELQSREGSGSRFTLIVPRSLPAGTAGERAEVSVRPAASTASPSTPPPAEIQRQADAATFDTDFSKKTILIVEDDAKFRAAVVDVVREQGFEPIEAGDGETALEIARRRAPSAILLDIRLPGLSGMSLLEIFKRMPSTRHVPTHVISAVEVEQNVLRMGAIGFNGKPVALDDLRAALSRIESILERNVRRLLIIEDDEKQNDAIRQLVQGPDVEIESAKTGERAMSLIEANEYDCIILDLTLPDLSGFALLDRIDKLQKTLPPIVVYTGKDLTPGEEEHLRKYSDSIIIKGAKSPQRLLDEVNLFLHRVEALLPDDKRQMLDQLRTQEKAFGGKTALLVDDDLRNLFALTSALEGKGLTVRVARNGLEALEALERHGDIDIVLMDLMMPKMDGIEATQRIRKNPRFRDLPIVALTAKAMSGDREKCIEAGANDYLPKPINLQNLLSVMKVWLGSKGIFT